MKLFAKGKGEPGAQAKAPAFGPIDRTGLLGLLAQVVNNGQSGVLELREPRGNWVYAFQGGALTHASGGRVRGARQAFDLLWEFQSGEFTFTPGVNPSLTGNLYIDKGRLLDLLQRSQAVLQGPSAPYIPPGQQRPIAPVYGTYGQPGGGQAPWQPGPQPGQYGGPPQAAPQAPGARAVTLSNPAIRKPRTSRVPHTPRRNHSPTRRRVILRRQASPSPAIRRTRSKCRRRPCRNRVLRK